MLLLPKGQTTYSGLRSAFTQFDAMLAELAGNGFTGYVRVTASDYDGVLLIDTGHIVTAIAESHGQRTSGPSAAQELAAQAHGKDATISVCNLSHEWVAVLSGMTEGETVFGKLNTDLVDLGALIRKLESSHHSGYVQVTFHAGGGEGFVLMQDGQVIESQLSPEDGTPPAQVLACLLERATARGADIVVNRADTETAFSHGEIISATLDLPRLLDIWQKILQVVEKSVDGDTHKGAFAAAFGSALDARTKVYPFLDRTKIFSYKDGQLKYAGKPEKDFNRAVGECIGGAIDELAAKNRSASLTMRTKVSLRSIRQENAGVIRELGLENALDWELTPYEWVLAEAWPFLGTATERIIERQCQEHLGLAPATLGFEQMRELGHWVEISSTLVISKDKARALGQRIADLSHRPE
jgi:hypothetical protein